MTLNEWTYSAIFVAILWALFYGASFLLRNPIHY